MLRDKVHGEEILNVRKALAFAGFTHKSPRAISYVRADRAFETYGQQTGERGRPLLREAHEVGKGKGRAMSM
jgi:protein-serine/threonine kinase